jgi:YD repeat-containing protein
MGDNRQQLGDQQLKEGTDSKVGVSDEARGEVGDGMEQQSKGVKDYYQARKDGMRDASTVEHLPPQPEFFDSKAALSDHTVSQPVEAKVDKDQQGRPTEITYPDGTSNKVEYGPDGNPNKMHNRYGSTWEKKDGVWTRYKDGQKVDDEIGNIMVTKDGTIVGTRKDGSVEMMKHPDGSTTEFGEDGQSQMSRNIDKQPTSMTYPDGTTNRIEYGPDGEVRKMQNRDGSTWKKEDGEWNRYDDKGKKLDDQMGDIKVTEDGDIVGFDKDGKVEMIKHPDGGTTHFGEDGTSQVTRDIDHKPTDITYPDGTTNRVDYDEQGNPSELQNRDGSAWKKENGEWNRYEADGKKLDDHLSDIQVTEDGDIVGFKDGKPDIIKHPDGSTTQYGDDGTSQTTKDINGKTISVTHPDGKTERVE